MKGLELMGVLESAIDPADIIADKKVAFEAQVNKLEKLKKQQKNVRKWDVAAIAANTKALSEAKANLNKVNAQSEPMVLLNYYKRKDQLLRGAYAHGAANMADPNYLNMISNSLAQNSKAMIDIQGELFKGKEGGEYKGVHKLAFVLGDDGKPVPGTEKWVSVPGTQAAGYSPSEASKGQLSEDYIWSDAWKLYKAEKGSAATPIEFKVDDLVTKRFGKQDKFGQFFVTKENQGMATNASRIAMRMLKDNPDANKVDIVNNAALEARNHHRGIVDIISKIKEKKINDKKKQEEITAELKIWKEYLESQGLEFYDPIKGY
jgi:hypothetical protein